MRKLAAILAFCASAALVGCGDSEGKRSDSVGEAAWTLTITSPKHGSLQRGRALVQVAITGSGSAQGESPDFDIGYFVDGELMKRSRSTEVQLAMPQGGYVLRVDGIDAEGNVMERVVGDEVSIEIGNPLDRGGMNIPGDLLNFPIDFPTNPRAEEPSAKPPEINVNPRLPPAG